MNIEIRVLTEPDAAQFWSLRLQALRDEPEAFGADYEQSLHTSPADVLKMLQSSEDSFILGAFAPHLVGMVGFYRGDGLKVRHKGTIWGTYVHPECRGQAIGKELMRTLIDRLSPVLGLEKLLLTVAATNRAAKSLYQSLGFKAYGTERRALKVGDRYVDVELMSFNLQDKTAM